MADRLFQKYPNIYYNGVLCKDLTRRVTVDANQDIQGTADVFYPYTIKQHLRPDLVAEYYYKDAEQDWLIFLANQIIDPYYQWYLTDVQHASLIKDKYGSFENAIRTPKFFRNNWASDSTQLTPDFYQNTLENDWKKYYTPVWGPGTRILSYTRKPIDTVVNTNKIVSYNIQYQSNTQFIVNEPVAFKAVESVIGTGQVIFANSSVAMIQSVLNETVANTSDPKIITGTQSGANVSSNSCSTVIENIADNELRFWSVVSMYDWEVECNEYKKDIYLIGAGAHSLISQQVGNTLKQNVDRLTGLSIE